MKRFLLAVIVIFACSLLPAARKALVIGNAQYQDKPLRNTVNDAMDIKAKLESLGFVVKLYVDTDLEQLNRAIYQFTESLDSVDEAVFYYAGHGAQVQGQNYLLPVKPLMYDELSIQSNSYKCDELLERMKKPQVSIIFLDACRNNPYSGTRSLTRGLASMSVPLTNQCVVFSTLAGQEALDGADTDRNSPFATALMKYLSQPLRFDEIFRKVREEVESMTGNKQIPTRNGDLRTDYYFVSKPLQPFATSDLALPALPGIELNNNPPAKPEAIPEPTIKPEARESEPIIVKPAQAQPLKPEPAKPTEQEPKFTIVNIPKPPSAKPAVSEPTLPKQELPKIETVISEPVKIAPEKPSPPKPEPVIPQIIVPTKETTQPSPPEVAKLTPAQPVQTIPPPVNKPVEYGSVDVISNVEGEIFVDDSPTAYKSILRNTRLTIDKLHAGDCRITFRSAKYTDSKDVFVYKDQVQPVVFSFPEPVRSDGFVSVDGGTFNMGSYDGAADEKPVHVVLLSPYCISTCEVTVGQFRQFVKEMNYKSTAELKGKSTKVDKKTGNFKTEKDLSWQNPGYESGDNYPVSCVSWLDAIAYCNWRSDKEKLTPVYSLNQNPFPKDWSKGLISFDPNADGYRLPTEAEWEFAARAQKADLRYSGSNKLDEVAVYAVNSGWHPWEVGSRQPNNLGIYDLTGNVAEWCWDWYEDSYYAHSDKNDPQGPQYPARKGTPTRVVRGGTWYFGADRCAVSSRDKCEPDYQENGIGFRLVKNLK